MNPNGFALVPAKLNLDSLLNMAVMQGWAIRVFFLVQYQNQDAGIGIVLVVFKNHLHPIPNQYQSITQKKKGVEMLHWGPSTT